ncbi:hypothetical protein [Umezawaea sp. Da 62-37]|uniref:hypothetical protein n=1 Tax=Umezawaea sp. Da 62-37 TaxID=3075927 RepID=UPI0028F6D5E4|nr:hypothetical protein [Umezawaea sp. Da 62-37]WNV83559.1 hypothetical protein RM788_36040 [Umezawaea sp. Da 62-37]
MSPVADDKTAKLVEELRSLIDVAAERAQPWLQKVATAGEAGAEHTPQTCGWCPLCNGAALLRGDRSELASKAAEHVSGLITVLRMALGEPGAAPEPEPATEEPRVQHIQVVRRRTAQGSQC